MKKKIILPNNSKAMKTSSTSVVLVAEGDEWDTEVPRPSPPMPVSRSNNNPKQCENNKIWFYRLKPCCYFIDL